MTEMVTPDLFIYKIQHEIYRVWGINLAYLNDHCAITPKHVYLCVCAGGGGGGETSLSVQISSLEDNNLYTFLHYIF